MSKIPCRKCPKCGLYHDLSVLTCKCGEELSAILAKLIELDDIPIEQLGTINKDIITYVQRCPKCKTSYFSLSKDKPAIKCDGCGKKLDDIKPKQFIEKKANKKENSKADISNREVSSHKEHISQCVTDLEKVDQNKDDDWFVDKRSNIEKIVGLGKRNITFTAIRGGELSFTIKAEDEPYMLGRSSNQSNFLKKDRRVGNEHCCIFFKNGSWYVKDNNSKNGTFVNSEDIGQNGEKLLKDGDELKLGHNVDSITFSVEFSQEEI